MTASEDHSELIVFNLRVGKEFSAFGSVCRPLELRRDFVLFFPKDRLPSQNIQGAILSDLQDPGRRVFRNIAIGPLLQSFHHRVLNNVFSELKVVEPENSGKSRNHSSGFMTKEIIY